MNRWQYPKKEFVYVKRVLIKQTNAFGNVYFSNYLEWQGEARESLLLEHPNYKELFSQSNNLLMITHSIYNRFIKSAFFGMHINMHITSSLIQKYSFVLNFHFFDSKNELISAGWQKICFFDNSKNVFIPIPDIVLDLVEPIKKE